MKKALWIETAACTLGYLSLGWAVSLPEVAHSPWVWPFSWLLAALWVALLYLFVAEARAFRIAAVRFSSASITNGILAALKDQNLLALWSLLILGVVFRSLHLGVLPWGYAGLHIDGAYNSEVAFRVVEGQQYFAPIVSSIAYIRDAWVHFYLAVFFGLFGKSIQVLRLACNALVLLNGLLFYGIVKGITSSRLVVFGTLALFLFSGTDAIMAMSGMEYVIVTPFLLASFFFLRRAFESGRGGDAALAGVVWGVGIASHYSYLGLGLAIPAVMIARYRSVRDWWKIFCLGGLLGAIPKLCMLVFNFSSYMQRSADVTRHDDSGRLFVSSALWANSENLYKLLFEPTPYLKWLLPGDPLIPAICIPFAALGVLFCLRRVLKIEHMWLLLITGITLGANIMTFPMDYRFITYMPCFYLTLAVAFAALQEWGGHRPWMHSLLGLAMGVLLLQSFSQYYLHRDSEQMRQNYGTAEVALARNLSSVAADENLLVVAPGTTWKTQFFHWNRPGLLTLNRALNGQEETQFSKAGEEKLLRELANLLARGPSEASKTCSLIVSTQSPYAGSLQSYILGNTGGRSEALEVTDPVSGITQSYFRMRFFRP